MLEALFGELVTVRRGRRTATIAPAVTYFSSHDGTAGER